MPHKHDNRCPSLSVTVSLSLTLLSSYNRCGASMDRPCVTEVQSGYSVQSDVE